jgi:hypothetical protein
LVGVAVKVTASPKQSGLVPVVMAMLTAGTKLGLTVKVCGIDEEEPLPATLVTTTLPVPEAPAGKVAVIDVLLTGVKVAATPLIVTPLAPVKLVPVLLIVAPRGAQAEGGLFFFT